MSNASRPQVWTLSKQARPSEAPTNAVRRPYLLPPNKFVKSRARSGMSIRPKYTIQHNRRNQTPLRRASNETEVETLRHQSRRRQLPSAASLSSPSCRRRYDCACRPVRRVPPSASPCQTPCYRQSVLRLVTRCVSILSRVCRRETHDYGLTLVVHLVRVPK